jgi:hypothetical protein
MIPPVNNATTAISRFVNSSSTFPFGVRGCYFPKSSPCTLYKTLISSVL